jgi:hypothetical protein
VTTKRSPDGRRAFSVALSAVLLLVLTLTPLRAFAFELQLGDQTLRLDIAEYGAVAYHVNNGNIAPPTSPSYDPTGSDFVDWLNKFEIDAVYGNFSALLRLDSALYVHAPVAAPGNKRLAVLLENRYNNRLDLEKVAVNYTSRHFEVTLGDSYVTFGRGLVLSLRKVDELGVDTTVRGLNAVGKVAGLEVNGIAGVSNIVNVDAATGREADDPNDVIAGARAEYHVKNWFTPGIDVVEYRYHQNQTDQPQKNPDQILAYSATLELPHLGDYGTLFVEYAQQQRLIGDSFVRATGFYGSGSFYFGPVTLLAEYKDYRNYQPIATSLRQTDYPELALTDFYNAPPTLERVQQAVLDNAQVNGGHARVDVAVCPGFSPFASFARFEDQFFDTIDYDPYGGFELRWQGGRSRASLSGGVRTSHFKPGNRHAGQLNSQTQHVEFDVNQALTGPYSIELDGLHMSHRDRQTVTYLDWLEGEAYLSLKRANSWAAAAGYEYYTEAPTAIQTGYVNATGSWNINSNLTLRAFVGGQRAGIKCINGVCRNYPAFQGYRLELIAKY